MLLDRAEIQEGELVYTVETIPGPKWTKKLRVDAGTVAVITIDGAYRETLPPGGHFLARYPIFTRCKVQRVNTKDRQLTVATKGEIVIQEPAPAPVDVTAVVSFRVVDPKVVAVDVDRPLHQLYDFTVEALRYAVSNLNDYEFRHGGQATVDALHYLQKRDLEQFLGIKVLNIQINGLQVDQRVQTLRMNESLNVREAQAEIQGEREQLQWELDKLMSQALNDRDRAKVIDLSLEYLALTNPELIDTVYGNATLLKEKQLEVLAEIAKNGGILPESLAQLNLAGALGQAVGAPPNDGNLSQSSLGLPTQSTINPVNNDRLAREYITLREKGVDVSWKEEPGGYYYLIFSLSGSQEQQIQVYFVCSQAYPNDPPQVMVEIDGEARDFESTVIAQWQPENELMQVVKEVKDLHGI